MRKYTSALQVALQETQPGNAAEYFEPITSIEAGDRVLICCRVSEETQRKHLDHQEASLRSEAEKRGAMVVGVWAKVRKGHLPHLWLGHAVALAQQYGAKLLFETPNRAIRSPYYDRNNQTYQARTVDLEELKWITEGLTLVTLGPPNATPGIERSQATKRGQKASGRKGGRPVKKKETQKQLARRMRSEGKSWNEIAAATGKARSTVRRWAT